MWRMKGVRFKAGAGMIQSVPLPVLAPLGLEPELAPLAPELGVVPVPLGLAHSSASSKGVVAVLASSLQYRWEPPLTII